MSANMEKETQRTAKIFAALGNKTRLKILLLLQETTRPLHIKAVAETLNIDYAALYRHVKILQKSGLLDIYEVGRSRVLAIKNRELLQKLIETANKTI